MAGNDKMHVIGDKWARIRNLDVCAETEPTQTWPYMMWIQPSAGTLKVRNRDDDGWVSIGGGGGGAPADAQYLVLALDGTLTDERRFVDGDGLILTDGGAGGDATLAVDSTVVRTSGDQTIGGVKTLTSNLVLDDGVGDSPHIHFVAGTNDDIVEIRLDDEPTPNTSSFVIVLAGDFLVLSSGHTHIFHTGTMGDFTLDAGDLTIDAGDIILNNNHYVGLGDSKGRIAFDSTPTPDSIEFKDCHVGIGPTGSAATAYLLIQDTSLECTGYWYGIFVDTVKTAGATDEDDYMHGGRFEFTMNDPDSTIGFLRGIYVMAELDAGTVGTVASNRVLYGIQSYARQDGGTINGSLYAAAITADVNGGTITNDIVGLYASADIEAAVTSIGDDVFGAYILTDAGKDPTGVVYNLYLVGQTANNVDYNLYQAGTASNVFSAGVRPASNKGVDLGTAGYRWATIYSGNALNSGTSRLVEVEKDCPICSTKMVRSTGGLLMTGETRDYQLVFCPACGAVAVEEIRHRISEEKNPPPKVELEGIHVEPGSSHSRHIRVSFRYTDRVVKKKLMPGQGDELKEVDHVADEGLTNSTWLSDDEVAQFLALATDADRRQFLLALGQREWEALEEIKQMEAECQTLQAAFDGTIANLVKTDLLQGVAA